MIYSFFFLLTASFFSVYRLDKLSFDYKAHLPERTREAVLSEGLKNVKNLSSPSGIQSTYRNMLALDAYSPEIAAEIVKQSFVCLEGKVGGGTLLTSSLGSM